MPHYHLEAYLKMHCLSNEPLLSVMNVRVHDPLIGPVQAACALSVMCVCVHDPLIGPVQAAVVGC